MLSVNEVRSQSHITIKFMVALQSIESYLLKDHYIKIVEDQGIFFSKVKIISLEISTDRLAVFHICITNFEENSFRDRCFSIHFEEFNPNYEET